MPKHYTKILALILLAAMLVLPACGNKAAAETHVADVSAYSQLVILCGNDLEEITNIILEKWDNAIKYGNGMSSYELEIALYDARDAISRAESYQAAIITAYKGIRKAPKGLEDIGEAANELYTAFDDYYRFALNPSGSYISYGNDNRAKKDAFIAKYRALNLLIEP